MSNAEIVMLVGGVLAIILGLVDALRVPAPGNVSMTSLGVVTLGVVFVILAFT